MTLATLRAALDVLLTDLVTNRRPRGCGTPACRKRIYQAIREAGGDPRDAEIQQPEVAKEPEIKQVLKPPVPPVEPATPRPDGVMNDGMPIPERAGERG